MSVDILGTSWDQCQSMIQYSFTYTETRRLIRTNCQDGLLDSHSSRTMLFIECQLLNLVGCPLCVGANRQQGLSKADIAVWWQAMRIIRGRHCCVMVLTGNEDYQRQTLLCLGVDRQWGLSEADTAVSWCWQAVRIIRGRHCCLGADRQWGLSEADTAVCWQAMRIDSCAEACIYVCVNGNNRIVFMSNELHFAAHILQLWFMFISMW